MLAPTAAGYHARDAPTGENRFGRHSRCSVPGAVGEAGRRRKPRAPVPAGFQNGGSPFSLLPAVGVRGYSPWSVGSASIYMWSRRRAARCPNPVPESAGRSPRRKLGGNRVVPSTDDRAHLLAIGSELGHSVGDLIGIVTPRTYCRWVVEQREGRAPKSTGRPKTARSVCKIVNVWRGRTPVGVFARHHARFGRQDPIGLI